MVRKFLQRLKEIDLPREAQIVDSYFNFGILWDNSNHCDVEVMILVETSLSPAELESILDKARIKAPFSQEYRFPEIMFLEDNQLLSIDYKITKIIQPSYKADKSDVDFLINFIKKHNTMEKMNYFLVRTWDQTYSGYSMNDLRCY